MDLDAQSEQLTGRRSNYPLISNTLRIAHKNIIESTERDQVHEIKFPLKKQTRSLTPKKSGEVPMLEVRPQAALATAKNKKIDNFNACH